MCIGRGGLALAGQERYSVRNSHFSDGQCHYNCANPGLWSFWPVKKEMGRERTQRLAIKQKEKMDRESWQNTKQLFLSCPKVVL